MLVLLLLAGAGWVAWRAVQARAEQVEEGQREREELPIAVETAPVERGRMSEARTLSGTLEASTRFDVAARQGGRLEVLHVDLGDEVRRGQVVAELEDEEHAHAFAQAEAALAVEEARRDQARIALELAEREQGRFESLRERGIASEVEYDAIVTAVATGRAALAVAEADVRRASALLELARYQLEDTRIRARWHGEQERAFVAARHQDAGSTVQPGDPILSVVVLDPLTVVIAITERDYARLRVGQAGSVRTDAFPERAFEARVERIAPVFRETSRQARLELRVANPEGVLKPGMFARVRVVLREEEAAAIVPVAALVRRQGEDVVFVVEPGGERVRRVPVEIGVVEEGRAQVSGEGLAGQVVTLGQQLLADGSRVLLVPPEDGDTTPAPTRSAPVVVPAVPAAGAVE